MALFFSSKCSFFRPFAPPCSSSSSSSLRVVCSSSLIGGKASERDAFEDAMRRFGIRSQIRLETPSSSSSSSSSSTTTTTKKERGLYANGNVGWKEPGLLLEVPLDVCIIAPIGGGSFDDGIDESVVTDKTAFDIIKSFERRNEVYLPPFTKKMVQAKSPERREMGLALWLLWAIAEEGDCKVWREYGRDWLPTKEALPSMLLAREEEELRAVCESFDRELVEDAIALKKKIKEMHVKFEIQYKGEEEIGLRNGASVEDLYYAFSLIRSRAIAARVGETPESRVDNTDVAVLAPCVDMANHAASKNVTALKKIGASDGGGMKGSLFRLVNGGTVDGGGGSVVLETRRPVKKDEEITISYGPRLDNKELMRAYGFSLEANRFDRLEIDDEKWALNATSVRSMCQEMEIVYQGVDEKTLNYVDAIVRSVSLDESDYDTDEYNDDNASEAVSTTTTTTTAETTTTNAKTELENAFKIHAAWSARLNAILETLSDADLEDEMESLIETADEQRRRKQNINDVTAFLPAALRYKQNHIRFLAKGCEVVQSYIDWLDVDDDE